MNRASLDSVCRINYKITYSTLGQTKGLAVCKYAYKERLKKKKKEGRSAQKYFSGPSFWLPSMYQLSELAPLIVLGGFLYNFDQLPLEPK